VVEKIESPQKLPQSVPLRWIHRAKVKSNSQVVAVRPSVS
jgi:hypothetical protein